MAKVKINFSRTTPVERRKAIKEMGKQLDLQASLQSLIESTLEFYARYLKGQMGDSRDVMRWAGAFDDYQALLREHFQHAVA
jgi:hypothetical protein